MKHIILASASPQRRKLLQLLGLPFTIKPSRAEEVKKIKTTCADLVKRNALIKAEDVARNVRSGIVIGADTVVYVGHKTMIGKPKNLKVAKKNLKLLMSHPHWVYTGVAVIDKEHNKTIVDYEKTKIHMTKLSDEEIDRYYQHMSPLDKAGGFDIEGKGSIFIRRIEGCYFNVVGLPIAKLCRMLKSLGVQVLSMVMVISLAGCNSSFNLATQRQESLLIGPEREKAVGASVSVAIEKEYTVISDDVELAERVEGILKRIVEVCDRKELVYVIKVLDEEELNAVSLPGGFIYLFKGIIEKAKSDDEIAGVIAHEVGHITAKHSIKRMQSMYGYTLLQVLAVQSGDPAVAQGVMVAMNSIFLEYSRDDEFEADKLAVKYLKKAGYDPNAMATFLGTMKENEDKQPARKLSYWRTHPYLSQRISVVNTEVQGEMQFKDYINLIGDQ